MHLLRGLKRLESRLRRQARQGRSYFGRYVNVSCWPPAPPSGPSIRVTCVTSIGASCGWSLLTDRAAHSDTHSRLQPHEHVTSQRGFPVVVNRSWSAAASGATSYKPTSRPLALPRPLRVPTEHPGSHDAHASASVRKAVDVRRANELRIDRIYPLADKKLSPRAR